MTRVGMGKKRRCLSCNTAFFDLNRAPVVCPKCAEVFHVVDPLRSSVVKGGFVSRAKPYSPASEPSPVDIPPESIDEVESEDALLAPADEENEESDRIEQIT